MRRVHLWCSADHGPGHGRIIRVGPFKENTAHGALSLVVSGDCVYSSRILTGHNHDGVYQPLNNAVGSVWDQLKTIDRINSEIGRDLGRLIILHDSDRWKGLPESRRSRASRS